MYKNRFAAGKIRFGNPISFHSKNSIKADLQIWVTSSYCCQVCESEFEVYISKQCCSAINKDNGFSG